MKNKSKIRSLEFSLEHIFSFAILGIFIAIVPLFVHNQWFTGPFVNTLLLLTCVLVGPMEAIFLGLIPSTIALSSGTLPLPLAPMIPFIMISNAIFVATFHYLNKKNFSLGVLIASFLKFVFLFCVSTFLAQNLLSATLLPKIAIMMGWVQFATALLGGLFAYIVLRFLKKK